MCSKLLSYKGLKLENPSGCLQRSSVVKTSADEISMEGVDKNTSGYFGWLGYEVHCISCLMVNDSESLYSITSSSCLCLTSGR